MIRAVSFDAAGTLFRVRGSVGAAYARIAAHHGVRAAPEDIERRFRAAFRDMPPMCFPGVAAAEVAQHENRWWQQVVRAAFAGCRFDDFDAFFHELFAYFARGSSWRVFPDALPALQQLRQEQLRLAIVSNFDRRLEPLCDALGLRPHVDAIVRSTAVGAAKPDPRIFTIMLSQLGVAAADCLHVGDSAALDIAGAHAAGLRAILIDRDQPSAWPDRIGDLRELAAHVDG